MIKGKSDTNKFIAQYIKLMSPTDTIITTYENPIIFINQGHK